MAKTTKGNGKKSAKQSNRDDFDSGKKVSASKPTKIPRKQLILKKIAETNPEQLKVKVDYTSTKAKPVSVIEKVLTGTPAEMAKVIYDGSHIGLVQLDDDVFRVAIREVNGNDVIIVYAHNTRLNNDLKSISGDNTFINLSQLHAHQFSTGLKVTKQVAVQMKMYYFLRNVFRNAGLLPVPIPKQKVEAVKKTIEQSVPLVVEQSVKVDPFEIHRKAYAKAEKIAIPILMNETLGEYEVFGLTIRVGKHPNYDKQKANGEMPKEINFLTIVRSGGELGKIKAQPRLSFYKLVFGSPETDNVKDDQYKLDTIKAIAFLRKKLAKEIGFKLAEKAEFDKIKEERKKHFAKKPTTTNSTETIPEESQIAVASETRPTYEIPPGAEVVSNGRGIYGRCHGSHSTHQKV